MASYALHTPWTTPFTYLSLFGTGALIMRGAGCTINDLWDRKLDKAVGELYCQMFEENALSSHHLSFAASNEERTKERPLARGDITPTQAFAFLGLQLSAGLGVLVQLNWYRYVMRSGKQLSVNSC